MPDFESIIKLPPEDALLHERLADAERRLAELEERAEFTERVFSDVRKRPGLLRD